MVLLAGGPRLLLGTRTSAGNQAKRRAVGLAGCIPLVIKRVGFFWGGRREWKTTLLPSRIGRFTAANHTQRRVRARLRRRAWARPRGPSAPARASVPPAPDLQSVTLCAERRPRKGTPPAPPIQSVNAKWSKLTRRQSRWLQVGEAPYSLHSPASMQPRGASFRRPACKRAGH